MGIAVYPLLSLYLETRRLSADDLARQVEAQFGVAVHPDALAALLRGDPVHEANLDLAGAIASVLGLRLGDLFLTAATAVDGWRGAPGTAEDLLDPAQGERLDGLLDLQQTRELTGSEQGELRTLVATYGGQLHEQFLRDWAEQHDISVDEARRGVETNFEEAVARWREHEADPRWRQELAAIVQQRRALPGRE